MSDQQPPDPDVVVSGAAEEPPPTPDEYRVPPESLSRAEAMNAAHQWASSEGLQFVNSIGKDDVDYVILADDQGVQRSFRVGPDGSLTEEEAPQPTPSAQTQQETTTAEGV